MLSGPHLVFIGLASTLLAFLVFKAVEAANRHKEGNDPPDGPES